VDGGQSGRIIQPIWICFDERIADVRLVAPELKPFCD